MLREANQTKAGESKEMKCLRRVMAPRADGTFLVPQEIQDLFKDMQNGGRESVMKMWRECDFNKDPFVKSFVMWLVNGLIIVGLIPWMKSCLALQVFHFKHVAFCTGRLLEEVQA